MLPEPDRQKFPSIVGQAKTDLAEPRDRTAFDGPTRGHLKRKIWTIDQILRHMREQNTFDLGGIILMSKSVSNVRKTVALIKN